MNLQGWEQSVMAFPSSVQTMRAVPIVSVLLPVHNAERYLRVAVDSILAQTFTDFELLAIDDGSTDGSLAILRAFEARDSRVRVWSRENRGLVDTLNELIGKARGPYLARMDADDICRPQRFERQLAYLEANPNCVAVGSRVLLIDPQGMPICETANELDHQGIDDALLRRAGGVKGLCHPSIMARRDAVEQVGAYRAEFAHAEDIDHFLRLAEIGRLANLPEILLEHRQHLSSIGYTYRLEQSRAAAKAVEAARERRNNTAIAQNSSGSIVSPQSIADAHRKWAWWALMAGNVRTARKHAFRAFARQPFDIENLRVAACAIRGY